MTEPAKGHRLRPSRSTGNRSSDDLAGSRDSQIDTDSPPVAEPRRELVVPAAPTPPSQQPIAPSGDRGGSQTPPVGDDLLVLPVGALVAMRRSGGLLFSSCEVVVYSDGHLATSTVGGGRAARGGATRVLPAAQLATLRRTLVDIDFARLHAVPPGRLRPDAYAYEIVARTGRMTASIEAIEGAIHPGVAPLIRLLNSLLAEED